MQEAVKPQENATALGLIKYTKEERDFMQWCIGLEVSEFLALPDYIFGHAMTLYLRGDNGLRLGAAFEKNVDFDLVQWLGGHLQI